MSIVIVTENQYILAQKIHHVVMNEQRNFDEVWSGGRRKTVKDHYYEIHVIYVPETTNANSNGLSRDDLRDCTVVIRGHVHAHKVFANLIQQIREQLPDQMYLDTALERMIAGTDMEILKNQDLNDLQEIGEDSDRSSKKVRRPRKAKRRSKKVLRKPKR